MKGIVYYPLSFISYSRDWQITRDVFTMLSITQNILEFVIPGRNGDFNHLIKILEDSENVVE